jgi:prevent-host-death family protein
MERIDASKFKEQCLSLLDHLDPDGVVITKHGKPVARLIPIEPSCADLIGNMKSILHEHQVECRILTAIAIHMKSAELSRIFARVHIWPLDSAVCMQSTDLDFESDPADELIAATSVVHRIPLLTRDRKLRRSKVVPIARERK